METILILEDEESLRDLFGRILEAKGYTVLEAGSVEEAIRSAERHEGQIDLLIADVLLRNTSGIRIAENLKQRRPEMKLLFVSGYPPDELLNKGLLRPNTVLLAKPFLPDTLAAKVREILDSD